MKVRVFAVAGVAVLLLAGCTAEPLADQYADGSGQGYISGDGAITEIAVADRGEPIVFDSMDENGNPVSSADYAGQPYVVNIWYAACPPCRAEAPDLKALSEQYAGSVPFLGVNVLDTEQVAIAFATKFGIGYPSVMDVQTGSVQLALAGSVSPNAVPTTLVIDQTGRVAARISGRLTDPAILSAMIDSVLAEVG